MPTPPPPSPILCDNCNTKICKATGQPCADLEEELKSIEVDRPRNHVSMPDHETLATQARPVHATAPDREVYEKLLGTVNRAMEKAKMKDPNNRNANIDASDEVKNSRSVVFASYLRCFTLDELSEKLNQSKSTVAEQLNRTIQHCGDIILADEGLPPNPKGSRSAAAFKDALLRGTYK